MKLEDLTIKEVCSCIAILNKMQQEGILTFDLKTTSVTINTDNLTEYLEKQNVELQQRIDKAIEYMKNNATSNYFDKEKNMFRREEDLLEILKGVE